MALFLGWACDQMGQKCQYLAQKCMFWARFVRFGLKILIFTEGGKSFGTQITEKPPKHFVRNFFLVGHGTTWAKNANILPQMPNFAVLGPKILIFREEAKVLVPA